MLPHGLTAGVPPSVNSHPRALRGSVGGWSDSSTRSNTRFLRSVAVAGLTGQGIAGTLTLRDCPQTHEHWKKLRELYFMALRRRGLIRLHWLTEWQRRGVPHLHFAAWFDRPQNDLAWTWVRLAKDYGAGIGGQHIQAINDEIGWFKYLSKHASRGLHHYQRSPENIPQGWQKTGRMWGYLGDWPLREAIQLDISHRAFFVFRRLVRGHRLADARAAGHRRRIRQARGMLNCPDASRSSLRGVSEWIDQETQLQMLAFLAAQGHEITQTA